MDRGAGGDESAAELAALVAALPDALISAMPSGRIRSWNPAAERMFGYRAEEVIGQPLALLMLDELRAEGREILARMLDGEQVAEYETERLTKDGRRIPVRIDLAPILSSGGALLGSSGIVHDLSGVRQARRKARLRTASFRSIIEAAPVAIWEEDLTNLKAALDRLVPIHGPALASHLENHPEVLRELIESVRILDVNPRALRMHGAGSKEELLAGLDRVYLPETIPSFRENCLALARGETLFENETVYGRLDGEAIEVRVICNIPGNPPD